MPITAHHQIVDTVLPPSPAPSPEARPVRLEPGRPGSCALCGEPSEEASLSFRNVRRRERVSLDLPLCGRCADKVEKHLKRMIPKRLMVIQPRTSF